MLRKLLIGLLVFVMLLAGGATFVYFKYLKPVAPPISEEDRAAITLMPLPASLKLTGGEFKINSSFRIQIDGSPTDSVVSRSVSRFVTLLSTQTGIAFRPGDQVTMTIQFDSATRPVQQAIENESYSLTITDESISLRAPCGLGIVRGLETLMQLVIDDDGIPAIPAAAIMDSPRYPWRGLMIDACRHWISKESILRNLDAMAAVKMNVLHWHLSESQAFRIESLVFPKLHQLGSGGHYYSQSDVREVIAYAGERGIRIVPEFDMPGHSTSWFPGYPQLATAPGPYVPDVKFGLLPPVMDPTKEEVYEFLDKFIGEMAQLFPDPYFHIGGDEVVPTGWSQSKSVQQFMKEKGFADHRDLQNYFNKRIQGIVIKHGKKMVGWDEILHRDLASGIVVQSWRGQKSLFEAVRAGRQGILSAGWYLDHKLLSSKHYQVDPEVLPGAVTIKPDSLNWQQFSITINVSDSPMSGFMTLYGKDSLRGLFGLMDNNIGFEKAARDNDKLKFTFASDYGEISVDARLTKDSINGKMSLGFLSFPFDGRKIGSNDMPGTHAPQVHQFKPLTNEEKVLILGGEAAIWTELVSDKNIDSRVWPRAAAIAERLWSPAAVAKGVDDMYRRLEVTSGYLAYRVTLQYKEYADMIEDLANGKSIEPVRRLLDVLEESKYYSRMTIYKDLTVATPLNGVVDAVRPESFEARLFNKNVEAFLQDTTHQAHAEMIYKSLEQFRDNKPAFDSVAQNNPRLGKVLPVSANLAELGIMGLKAMDVISGKETLGSGERSRYMTRLDELNKPVEGVLIAVTPGVRQLVEATTGE